MAKKKDTQQSDLFDITDRLTTAPAVPAIRQAVDDWRRNYKGVTDTTRELLNYWFHTDHRLPNGAPFKYHAAQREAIETLIYVYEVANVRTRKELLEKYAHHIKDLRLPAHDDFARYCLKMATGSGKTKVMSLAIAWQYFNAVREDETQYARNFLILAPNIIVFDRLRDDFGNGRIFRTDPLFPRHFELFWDMDFYMRGDGERASSSGGLYLTNIQQLYDRTDRRTAEPDIMTAMMGASPAAKKTEISDFQQRIAQRDGTVMVLNDEAHHTHDEESEWNNVIRGLHGPKQIISQLDFSATPRYSKGTLFPWTIFDYPLKQAILDRVVKRPIKGISYIEEGKSELAEVRYKGFLVAAVERWKEYKEQLGELNKKPLLFIMMNSTKEADSVGAWLAECYPTHFSGDKTLIIHTDNSGEVSGKDLEKARQLAREADSEASPVNAVVSVLMLREGWDVQNVTVVVGLRPYSAKANILPEQTIGRGLRLMFRNLAGNYQERVDIIGNKHFMEFVEDLERLEDIKFGTFEVGKDKLHILYIKPVDEKADRDISIPEISPLLSRKKSLAQEIAELDVMGFACNVLPFTNREISETKSFVYEGRDILTNEKLFEKGYQIPDYQTAEEVIGFYARRIAERIKLPSQFAALAPKVREFFERKAFGKTVELNTTDAIRAISSNLADHMVMKLFEKALREKIVEENVPELINIGKNLSETRPYPTSKTVMEASKTVFNYVPCDNEFEKAFAQFLQRAEDVEAFAKLPETFGFHIQYTDVAANIRNYYPDFIARLADGRHYVVETKGREDLDVSRKDQAASHWCVTATELTGTAWHYVKVPQKEFESLRPADFEEMLLAISME